MKTAKTKLSRRHFLLSVGAGTAAGAAAIVGTKRTGEAPASDTSPESKKGYQLTEHVRNYYRTTKV